MYHEFFGLRQAPFKITPDTRLFFPGGRRGEILDALVYAISSGEGITKVVGEVGSGKTMLCRMLEVRLGEDIEIVYLPNPSLTPEDILHAIALELGLEVNAAANRIHVMQALHQCLLEKHAANERVVVFVEEAQSMPLATLEEIRLLSNLETQRDKLLQIVLFGQPELDRNLNARNIRQLRERITHSFHLQPLSSEDIQQYVRYRMHAVGYRGPDVFDPAAYTLMAKASKGLTRRVNILADKGLLAAFAENTHNVSRKHVDKAIADSELGTGRGFAVSARAVATVAVLAVGIGIGVGWRWIVTPRPPSVLSAAASGAGASVVASADESHSPPGVSVAASEPEPMRETSRPREQTQPDTGTQAAQPSLETMPAEAEPAADIVARSPVEPASNQERKTVKGEPQELIASAELPVQVPLVEQPAARGGDAGDLQPTAPRAPAGIAMDSPGTAADTSPRQPIAATLPGVDVPAREAAPPAEIAPSPPSTADLPPAREALTQALPLVGAGGSAAPVDVTGAPIEVAPDPGDVRGVPAAAALESVPFVAEPAALAVAVASEAQAVDAGAKQPLRLLDQRLAAAKAWLAVANRRHFTIQLLATNVDQHRSLEAFLREWAQRSGRLERVYIYKTRIRGGLWFGVLYDEYKTFAEAMAALKRLPPEVKRYKPFIRNVRDIANLG